MRFPDARPSGFWGFKTFRRPSTRKAAADVLIFALTEHWGKMVEHESGLRSQYAEIMAFIEPVGPAQLAVFPREALARNYPAVPVIHQRDIGSKIEELGMVTLPRAALPPLMQWLGPMGSLRGHPRRLAPRSRTPMSMRWYRRRRATRRRHTQQISA